LLVPERATAHEALGRSVSEKRGSLNAASPLGFSTGARRGFSLAISTTARIRRTARYGWKRRRTTTALPKSQTRARAMPRVLGAQRSDSTSLKVIYKVTWPNGKDIRRQRSSRFDTLFLVVRQARHRGRFPDTRSSAGYNGSAGDSVGIGFGDGCGGSAKERELIVSLGANDPARGYNRNPAFKRPRTL
jgi:hypothetical protein